MTADLLHEAVTGSGTMHRQDAGVMWKEKWKVFEFLVASSINNY